MKAAYLVAPNNITMRQIAKPVPLPGEIRVKLYKTGICGSDVHLFLGHRLLGQPTIIGHEGLGVVDAMGEAVIGFNIGQRVVIEPNIPCGNCRFCTSGRGNICADKIVIGVNSAGCFAEYICLPAAFCWKVPGSISDEDAVTVEPMAVAYHALFCAGAKKGDAIAVVGLGAIGLLITQLATAIGYRVFVAELNEDKLLMAEEMGAVMLPKSREDIAHVWLKEEVAAIFDCAGVTAATNMIMFAAPRGSEIILVGLSEKPAEFIPLKIAREGITIKPSIIYDHPNDFKQAIKLIEDGVVKPGRIISSTSSLNDLQQALQLAATGGQSKIIVEI